MTPTERFMFERGVLLNAKDSCATCGAGVTSHRLFERVSDMRGDDERVLDLCGLCYELHGEKMVATLASGQTADAYLAGLLTDDNGNE